MASSNHLVTVCICLLCATHSSCSAHDGLVAEIEGLTKYQDLRHEKFKENFPAPGKGYSKSQYQYNKVKSPDKFSSEENQKTNFLMNNDVNYDPDYQTERVNLKDQTEFQSRQTHLKIADKSLSVSGSSEDAQTLNVPNVPNVRNWKGKRRSYMKLSAKLNENSLKTAFKDDSNNCNEDISQRLEDIQSRVGANPHLEISRIDEKILDLKVDESLPTNAPYRLSSETVRNTEVNEKSRFSKEGTNHKHADKNVLESMLRNEDKPSKYYVKNLNELISDVAIDSNGEKIKLTHHNQVRSWFKRKKRNAHLPEDEAVGSKENGANNTAVNLEGKDMNNNTRANIEGKDEKISPANIVGKETNNNTALKNSNDNTAVSAEDSDYKINLRNIDIDFYVKKLFIQFGDRDSMTMDLTGFDQLLKRLDLDRMVLEQRTVPQPPIEAVINRVRSNSTKLKCVNSADLVSSLSQQMKMHQSHHSTENSKPVNQTLSALKAGIQINANLMAKICPLLVYQKVAPTSYERQGCVVERDYPKLNSRENKLDSAFPHSEHDHDHEGEATEDEERAPNRTLVWAYSSLCILAISACGMLGVAVIPIMHHMYYQQILQFFVALAVGTLAGDAMLHLLPHALTSEPHGSGHAHAHTDTMWKGLVAMLGVVFFYFTEKCLSLITEWRKKRMRNDKKNKLPSRVRVMTQDIGCLKSSGSCSSHTGKNTFLNFPLFKPDSHAKNEESNSVPSSGKICKNKYSEYPYCYDEIATETQDDHHVRDPSKKREPHQKRDKLGDPLNVVSSNVLNEQESGANGEPDVNKTLLSGDSSAVMNKNYKKMLPPMDNLPNGGKSRCKNDHGSYNVRIEQESGANGEPDFNKTLLSGDSSTVMNVNYRSELPSVDDFLMEPNGGKSRSKNEHVRSRSADRATELDEFLSSGAPNPEQSYTVILREHSSNHHGHSHSHGHVHSPPSSLSSVVWMVIMGDGLHNFTDGMAIGAAFSSNIAGGFSTAIAVLCHELPHEIGDFAVLLKAGMSARRAICYNLLSSLLCLLGMVVGVAAGHTPEATSWIFAAAAGMFLYIALVDMIPELSSSHSNEGSFCQCLLQLSGLSCGIGIMLVIALYEHDLKRLFG